MPVETNGEYMFDPGKEEEGGILVSILNQVLFYPILFYSLRSYPILSYELKAREPNCVGYNLIQNPKQRPIRVLRGETRARTRARANAHFRKINQGPREKERIPSPLNSYQVGQTDVFMVAVSPALPRSTHLLPRWEAAAG